MAWVEIIQPEQAEGDVLRAYKRFLPKGASRFREAMGVLTQEPQVLEWFASLCLETEGAYGVTGIDARLVETLALTISVLNECHTCIAVHGTQLRQMSGSNTLTDQIKSDYATAEVDPKTRAAMAYAAKLTRQPEAMEVWDATALRDAGFTDQQIVDVAHVVGLFNYINRMARGLGTELHAEPKPRGSSR